MSCALVIFESDGKSRNNKLYYTEVWAIESSVWPVEMAAKLEAARQLSQLNKPLNPAKTYQHDLEQLRN
eukprot:1420565-Amphidinium_carterae.1